MDSINEQLAKLSRVPLAEKIFFIENLRVMVKAGLSMSEALETLGMQTKNKKFAGVIHEIKDGVVSGNTLGSMLEKHPKIFSEFFINMVKAGEISGNLEKNLEELGLQMRKDHDLISKVKGAMIYPIVILVATIGISILMFVYVIPSVLSVFEEVKIELPLATRILIVISKAVTNYGIFFGIGFILALILVVLFLKTKRGIKVAAFITLNMFVIGSIAKKVNLARFSRTFSSLLKTDIPVIDSIKITGTVLDNIYYREILLRVSEDVAKGISINNTLSQKPKLFPPIVTQMIMVGEKSGTLDTLLAELAGFYEGEVEDITKNLASIIEPILIVFLGGVVALIAFAVISPIYTLSQNM
jgi:type IV pilus assembly protein PilC